MTVTPIQHGPYSFVVDTAASVSDINSIYLKSGTRVMILDSGLEQVYNGSAWVEIALADAGAVAYDDVNSWTSTTTVETALDEVYSKLPVVDVLTADFDVTSGTTGATITATDLAVPVAASTTYLLDATLFVTATTNGGIEVDFTYPASTTGVWQAQFHDAASPPLLVNDGENAINGAVNYITTALTFSRMTITGYIVVSTTAGTFTLRGAQNTGHADNTIIHAGSWMKLTPVI